MVAHGRSNNETRLRNRFLLSTRCKSTHPVAIAPDSEPMSERVNSPARIEAARAKIAELLAAHAEWFCTLNQEDSRALNRRELDVAAAYGRLILTSWTEQGSRSWKIFAWEWTGEKLLLQA